ncbi:MAG: tetratricopeptide repeat protein [Chloroflexi bacterium]|nr:tetratricopeptide repeat protein [Chloroflexota bacterium]
MSTIDFFTGSDTPRLRRLRDQAIRLAVENRWEEAIDVNRAILSENPKDVDAYNRLGKALSELGRFREAREAYERALALDGNNIIAKKNLARLANVAVEAAPKKVKESIDPRLFLEEAGKTGVISLTNPASREVLAELTVGELLQLQPMGRVLHVTNHKGEYIGQVEPKLGQRLVKLMEGGNKYIAAVMSLESHHIKVFLREVAQHPSQAGRISFPPVTRELGTVRPYFRGRLAYDSNEEEEGLAESEGAPEDEGGVAELSEEGEGEEE